MTAKDEQFINRPRAFLHKQKKRRWSTDLERNMSEENKYVELTGIRHSLWSPVTLKSCFWVNIDTNIAMKGKMENYRYRNSRCFGGKYYYGTASFNFISIFLYALEETGTSIEQTVCNKTQIIVLFSASVRYVPD